MKSLKNNIIIAIVVLTIATISGLNVSFNLQSKNLSELSLSKIEAIADEFDYGITCSSSCSFTGLCYDFDGYDVIHDFWGIPIVTTRCRFTGYMANNCTCSTSYNPMTGY
ncbi:hypothetical protein FACS189440_21610 [Bacteroidia bacterium]|nr:hypothetical protein FACS189440_21610 [Bacteroidia bacterium]